VVVGCRGVVVFYRTRGAGVLCVNVGSAGQGVQSQKPDNHRDEGKERHQDLTDPVR
jgi:hypothetical protein